MTENVTPALVTSDWLAAHLDDPNIRLLDATFKLPGATPSAEDEYVTRHIPNAVFFDIDHIADSANPLPHMLPSPAEFQAVARKLGISTNTHVVVYDAPGLMSAGRAWWTLRVYGHDNVSVLDGGLRNWMAEERPTTAEVPVVSLGNFVASYRANLVRSKAEMLDNVQTAAEQVVDARPEGRFRGIDKEARPGLRSGHIPNSHNLPSSALTDAQTGRLKSRDEIAALFNQSGIRLDRPIAATCGSGVTAAALVFALHTIGVPDVPVYDGAWAEWGAPGETPVSQ